MRIRTATDADWPAVRDLCCLTGAAGAPIARSRWRFFARQWIGPYEENLPQWAYVADVGGVVRGYLTGCPDTGAFRWRKAAFFALPTMLRAAAGHYGFGADVKKYVRRALHLERSPESRFSWRVRRRLAREFPAHLHVNVDATYRAGGVGRALVERFCSELRKRGVPGVHVFCGAGPVKFYKALGFEVLESVPVPAGRRSAPVPVFCMARALP